MNLTAEMCFAVDSNVSNLKNIRVILNILLEEYDNSMRNA